MSQKRKLDSLRPDQDIQAPKRAKKNVTEDKSKATRGAHRRAKYAAHRDFNSSFRTAQKQRKIRRNAVHIMEMPISEIEVKAKSVKFLVAHTKDVKAVHRFNEKINKPAIFPVVITYTR